VRTVPLGSTASTSAPSRSAHADGHLHRRAGIVRDARPFIAAAARSSTPPTPMPGGPYAVAAAARARSCSAAWFARSGRRDEVFLATRPVPGSPAWTATGATTRHPTGPSGGADSSAAADTLRTAIETACGASAPTTSTCIYVHVDDLATPAEETSRRSPASSRRKDPLSDGPTSAPGDWSRPSAMRAHGWPAPVALQQQHSYCAAGWPAHPVNRRRRTLTTCNAHHDVTLVSYSPILKGTRRPRQAARSPDDGVYEGPDADARIRGAWPLAAEIGVTPNQLVLAGYCNPDIAPGGAANRTRTLDQYEARSQPSTSN